MLSDAVKLLIWIGVVLFVLGAAFRFLGFGDHNPVDVINLTPGAFHRAADTFILLAAAVGLWGLLVIRERQSAGGSENDSQP